VTLPAVPAACGGSSNPARPTAAVNSPPLITGLTAQGTRPAEPPNLADAGEELVVTASVVDAGTAVDRLTFEWSSPVGSFSGQGPAVRWRAPASASTGRTGGGCATAGGTGGWSRASAASTG
jgi:hypothetical protein